MKKKDLLQRCRKILYSSNITLDDKEFLKELLKLHPKHESKIGCGIKDFFIKKTIYNNLGFNIVRFDGSTTDFSFMKCINPKNKLSKIKCACRNAISTTIQKLKTDKNKVIHHQKISFDTLVNRWMKINNLDLSINKSEDNNQETYFINKETIISFIKYHDSNAILIELDKEKHKKEHKRKEE